MSIFFAKTVMLKRKFVKQAIIASHMQYIILFSMCCVCYAGTENLTSAPYAANPTTNVQGAAARTILRIYDECARLEGGFVPCLKKKAISFLDRISHIEAITVADGIKLVRLPGTDTTQLSDNELEQRSDEDRDTKLTNMLIERLSQFFNRHTLQVNFPKLSSEEIGRSLEEGRGKMKKMMSMMIMGMAMKMMGMIPVAMGGLYMMAGKALIISKIALLLAGIMGLKKLMSGRGGGGGSVSAGGYSGGGGGGWSSGGGGGGGWDRRSLGEAHDLAYRSYRALQPTQTEVSAQQINKKQKQQQESTFKPLAQQQLQQGVQKS